MVCTSLSVGTPCDMQSQVVTLTVMYMRMSEAINLVWHVKQSQDIQLVSALQHTETSRVVCSAAWPHFVHIHTFHNPVPLPHS